MRTKTLLVVAAISATGLASSLAQSNVYSQNVVGYVNRVLQGNNNYSLVANPLSTTNNTYGGLLQGLPVGFTVLKWNGASFNSATANFISPASRIGFQNGWSPNGAISNSFNVGDALFIRAGAGAPPFTNTFVGEVLQGVLTNALPTGLSLKGNMVPDAGAVTNASWAFNPAPGTVMFQWKEDGVGGYNSFTKTGFGQGWSLTVPNLAVAQGFFFNNNSGSTYNWVRNFTVQ